jgi:hypothetical protein
MQFQAISEPSASVLIKAISDIGKVWFSPGFLYAGRGSPRIENGLERRLYPVLAIVESAFGLVLFVIDAYRKRAATSRAFEGFDRNSGIISKPVILLEKCFRHGNRMSGGFGR